MKFWIYLRNIFILLKVLQYFSFKVTVKSLLIWNRAMYISIYQGVTNSGQLKLSPTFESSSMNSKAIP